MHKTLEEFTFEELVQYHQGLITLAIPTGKFNEAVWLAMDHALQWKWLKDQKENRK